MNDPMFVETLIISSSFFIIAIILIASVLLLENGWPLASRCIYCLRNVTSSGRAIRR